MLLDSTCARLVTFIVGCDGECIRDGHSVDASRAVICMPDKLIHYSQRAAVVHRLWEYLFVSVRCYCLWPLWKDTHASCA